MTQDPDEWLMSQVACGRQEALEPLVRRYANPLLTFIRGMISDHHRSEELFQDVFVAVWRKRQQYEPSRRFKPWLYAIALNVCRAEFRRRKMVVLPVEDEDMGAELKGTDPPDEVAVMTERATLVLAAVKQLPPKQRAVVVLRTWLGLSYGQIAEVLCRREGTVRAHMHQALGTLREYLEPRLG